jgi:hypothetical protein
MIEPVAFRQAWLSVRDRVQEIADRDNEPWIAEDVFHELASASAFLWATEDLEAFVVLTIKTAPYTRDLHIWIGCENTEANAADYWPQLVEIARQHGCGRIMFESQRRWERALPNLTVRHVYEFQV